MNSTETGDHTHIALSTRLSAALREGKHGLTVGELLDEIGPQGFGLLLMVFSLPSALPVPAPGYSTPFGCILAFLGLQLLCGREQPWAPERWRRWKIPSGLVSGSLKRGQKLFQLIEKIVRPRFGWITRAVFRRLLAIVVVTMGVLMILPIPLTNTAPAFVVFLIGAALCEEDGLIGIAAAVIGAAAVAGYALVLTLVIYFVFVLGGDMNGFKDWLKGLM